MQWNLLITGCSILLIILLVLKEKRRPDRRFLPLRVLASILAVGSLAAMALPLSIKSTERSPTQGPLILITPGAEPDSVRKFIDHRNLPVFSTDPAMAERFKGTGARLIGGTDYLAAMYPGRSLEIFGYGLDAFDLQPLSGHPFRLHPPEDPQGVTSVQWPMKLNQGATLKIQGFYHNGSGQPVKLMLQAFGTTLDSVTVSTGGSAFELTSVPRHLGRSVLSLVCLSGRDTLSRDPVPVTVEKAEPLKVLLLSAAPDFEYKFLKNWLTAKGHETAVRTRISKDKFELRFINTRRIGMDRITPGRLSAFDVVIADHAELTALAHEHPGLLESAVRRNGLGLVVRTDSLLKGGFYARHFPVRAVANSAQPGLFRLAGDHQKEFRLEAPAEFMLQTDPGTRPVLTDKRNNVLISSRLFGAGYVLVSTLQDTYSLMLRGRSGAYGEIWSAILSAAAGRHASEQVILPFFPRAGEPAELEIRSASAGLPRVSVAGTMLAPEQNMNLYDRWKSVYWPEKTGWSMVESAGSETHPFFVYGDENWQAVRYHERLKHTRKAASGVKPPLETGSRVIKKPLPRIWPLLVFLICCGFLWYETKILSGEYYPRRKNM